MSCETEIRSHVSPSRRCVVHCLTIPQLEQSGDLRASHSKGFVLERSWMQLRFVCRSPHPLSMTDLHLVNVGKREPQLWFRIHHKFTAFSVVLSFVPSQKVIGIPPCNCFRSDFLHTLLMGKC
jgi:hypothetical protein